VKGRLHGFWGFQAFDGPLFHLRSSRPGKWIVGSRDASALIVGRVDTLHLKSPDTVCVRQVKITDQAGGTIAGDWRTSNADELEVKIALQDAAAGWITMRIQKFGMLEPDEIKLHTFAEASRLDGFYTYEGDSDGLLKGTRLDQVTVLDLGGVSYRPLSLARNNQEDELKLVAGSAPASSDLQLASPPPAHVTLKDGRVLEVKVVVSAPRPRLTMISLSAQMDQNSASSPVHLSDPDDLPEDGRLSFFVKTQVPEAFPPNEKVEVATADESFRVMLSVADGNLTLQDSKTVLAVLDPLKHLGPSAFGPLKFRPVSADGSSGDWQPLANLVRLPTLKGIRCTSTAPRQCWLVGEKLFLIDSVSGDQEFTSPVTVPDGFVDSALAIPAPKTRTLYFRLRDDPSAIDTAILPPLSTSP
jgi:hypothetical protein